MITLPIFIMIISIAGLSYLIGTMHGYDRGSSDVERIYKETK